MRDFPEYLAGDWMDNNVCKGNHDPKWNNRKEIMRSRWNLLHTVVPEYCKEGNKVVLDVACGSGSMLEIFRHFGYKVSGLDVNPAYFPLLKSQGLDYQDHNCTKFPYPVADKSADLVICWGAFTFFPVELWPDVLTELARISRRTIAIGVNRGPELDQGRELIDKWTPAKWQVSKQSDYIWKWEAI